MGATGRTAKIAIQRRKPQRIWCDACQEHHDAREDHEYVRWVRNQPCCSCRKIPHAGKTHPHHKMGGGVGRKTHDHTCVPLCWLCHMDIHNRRGLFTRWPLQKVQAWHDHKMREVREAYEKHQRLSHTGDHDW